VRDADPARAFRNPRAPHERATPDFHLDPAVRDRVPHGLVRRLEPRAHAQSRERALERPACRGAIRQLDPWRLPEPGEQRPRPPRHEQAIAPGNQDNRTPHVLGVAGIMEGAMATCYPGIEIPGAQRIEEERVVRQGTIITSQGPGTAIDFALDLVEVLTTKENAREVRKALLA